MRHKGAPGGPGHEVRDAGQLGWDDSLYGEEPPDGERPGGAGAPGASGASGAAREDGGRSGPPRRRGRRVLRWSASVLSVLILGTAGAGYLYYEHLNNNIKHDDLNLGEHRAAKPTPNAAGQTPLNILLLGSDARDSKENQKLGGAKNTFGGAPLADVQMLLHLSADRSNMSVISMPRDTLLHIPKCTDPKTGTVYPESTSLSMTNATLGRGGPGCSVATWEELTGIHIDHFLLVDFAGVVDMADAIGGVPVCVDANIYSHTSEGKGSGLRLREGTTSVKGRQALQWLRTRYGFEDNSDIGRTKAQHQYMNSMARQLRENATLSSPGKLRSLAETATTALTTDPGLDTVKKLYDLSNELKKVEPKRITMTTMPWQWAISDHNRVEPRPGDAEQLFRLVREDIALDGKDVQKPDADIESKDPSAPDDAIAVQVRNGTATSTLAPVTGRATAVAQLLAGAGFSRATADPRTPPSQPYTLIEYPTADLEGDAQRVARQLGIPLASVKRSTNVSAVTLTVGADWREGGDYPKTSADDAERARKKDDRTPSTASVLNGADTKACMHVNPAFTW